MNKVFRIVLMTIIAFTPYSCVLVSGQDIPAATQQQLENLSAGNDEVSDDDSYFQQLESFRKHPVNLNTASAEDLNELNLLSEIQVNSLLSYRKLLGKLISVYELQAVPFWDIPTIRKVLPYLTISEGSPFGARAGAVFRKGEQNILVRFSQVIDTPSESGPASSNLGCPQRFYFRYKFNYKKDLQFGVTADKDAGEQFFRGAQKGGFDFYSFHLYFRKSGLLRSIAIGDYTVNMGQGLVHWQSMAFKKSGDVVSIKRQAPSIRPYHSAGEFYFHRGAAIVLRNKNVELMAFVSLRKLSANIFLDSLTGESYISSFLSGGYHRTLAEIADRNKVLQAAAGVSIRYRMNTWHLGINAVQHNFSLPIRKKDEAYNLYAISGRIWHGVSADYSYTYKNLHFFGEVAVDKRVSVAYLNGLLVSVDQRADLSFLYRAISAGYQSVAGNAFTEHSSPTNENGIYAGISIRPAYGLRLDGYADLFRFPWLSFSADAPANGIDLMLQFTYNPNKQAEIYTRFRNETKQLNDPGNTAYINNLEYFSRKSWRMHFNFQLNKDLMFRNRMDLVWYGRKGAKNETGYLFYIDAMYKPLQKAFSGAVRLQFFESQGNNSRLYAYENDVLYGSSIPSFSNKGVRYYFLVEYQLSKSITVWIKWAQTIYNQLFDGSFANDDTQLSTRKEIKLQMSFLF